MEQDHENRIRAAIHRPEDFIDIVRSDFAIPILSLKLTPILCFRTSTSTQNAPNLNEGSKATQSTDAQSVTCVSIVEDSLHTTSTTKVVELTTISLATRNISIHKSARSQGSIRLQIISGQHRNFFLEDTIIRLVLQQPWCCAIHGRPETTVNET